MSNSSVSNSSDSKGSDAKINSEAGVTPDFERAGDLREWVWAALMKERQVAYPLPPRGHHPNFKGAGVAAARLVDYLLGHAHLSPGDSVLSYPDYVLKPLRKRLLEEGINVIVPAKYGDGYRLLDPHKVPPGGGSSIAGAERHGEMITALPELRIAFIACVAVSEQGDTLDKGYGFRLPEELHALPKATLAHPLQHFKTLPEHSFPVMFYATPQEVREK